jgi:hypothetical protein
MMSTETDAARYVDPALTMIVDSSTTVGYTYICEAAPGTASSAALWRICKVTDATGNTVWADGNGNFDNVADNRASLSYS